MNNIGAMRADSAEEVGGEGGEREAAFGQTEPSKHYLFSAYDTRLYGEKARAKILEGVNVRDAVKRQHSMDSGKEKKQKKKKKK